MSAHRPRTRGTTGAWLLLALTGVTLASAAHAFDGSRKGFTMGLHVGVARVDVTRPARGPSYVSVLDSLGTVGDTLLLPAPPAQPPRDGLTTQLKLGYGFSPSVRVCYTVQTDINDYGGLIWATEAGRYNLGASSSIALDWYPGGAQGRWFGSCGVGYGDTSDHGGSGPAYQLSAGWDFWKGAQLQATLARYGTSTHRNTALRLLLGWMWD